MYKAKEAFCKLKEIFVNKAVTNTKIPKPLKLKLLQPMASALVQQLSSHMTKITGMAEIVPHRSILGNSGGPCRT